ncbi:MAG TPA: hypothetical protein DD656_06060 [Alphaproteobacteria bacterium]|nr:hypothetical protein [Alphaproteobacteria bacterium]
MSKDNLPASIELEARFVHLPLGVWGMALMALWLPGLAGRVAIMATIALMILGWLGGGSLQRGGAYLGQAFQQPWRNYLRSRPYLIIDAELVRKDLERDS